MWPLSLRLKLIAVFAAVLLGTLGAAAPFALRMAHRAVEDEVGERTLELASATVGALRKTSPADDDAVAEELAATVRMHRGLGRAVLARASGPGLDADFVAAQLTRGGVDFTRWRGPVHLPSRPQSAVAMPTGDAGAPGRSWEVSVPFTDAKGLRASLTLSASLLEADRVAGAVQSVLALTAGASAVVLLVLAYFVLGRLVVRRIEGIAEVMRRVEGGDVTAVAAEAGGDELAYLARGFNDMLHRLRGFNRELTAKIDEATHDLAVKNKDLGELNELLVSARADLSAKERLAALGQLSGTIAHELGNPLNAISGHLQLLARRSDLAEPARVEIQVVQNEVQRMTQIIRRFLDSSRGLTPVPREVSLAHLVSEAVDLTLGAEARARVRVEAVVEPAADRVVCDPALVRHVLTNLLSNAVDATPGAGTVRVSGAREGGDVLLAVADTGTGMSPETKRRVFDPFFTTKEAGKGTGLGLAISKEIARAMRGRLDVESEPGRGSKFTLRFPAPPAEPKEKVA